LFAIKVVVNIADQSVLGTRLSSTWMVSALRSGIIQLRDRVNEDPQTSIRSLSCNKPRTLEPR